MDRRKLRGLVVPYLYWQASENRLRALTEELVSTRNDLFEREQAIEKLRIELGQGDERTQRIAVEVLITFQMSSNADFIVH